MERDDFDIAIVGGGSSGCVLARRFAEWGERRVLLLEAGPDLREDTPAALRDGWNLPSIPDWGFESEPDATGATRKLRRGRLLGGTSWLTRFAVRGAAADFDAWAASGNEGWGFDDVLPAFRRLESDAEFGDDPWHGNSGPIPVTRYPDQPVSEIHAAALAAFDGLGYPRVEDLNAPEAIGTGPDADELTRRRASDDRRCLSAARSALAEAHHQGRLGRRAGDARWRRRDRRRTRRRDEDPGRLGDPGGGDVRQSLDPPAVRHRAGGRPPSARRRAAGGAGRGRREPRRPSGRRPALGLERHARRRAGSCTRSRRSAAPRRPLAGPT